MLRLLLVMACVQGEVEMLSIGDKYIHADQESKDRQEEHLSAWQSQAFLPPACCQHVSWQLSQHQMATPHT